MIRTHIIFTYDLDIIIEGLRQYPANKVFLIMKEDPGPEHIEFFNNLLVIDKKIIKTNSWDLKEIIEILNNLFSGETGDICINLTNIDYHYLSAIYFLLPLFSNRRFILFDIYGQIFPIPPKKTLSEREMDIILALLDRAPLSNSEIIRIIMRKRNIPEKIQEKKVKLQYRNCFSRLISLGYIEKKEDMFILTQSGRITAGLFK